MIIAPISASYSLRQEPETWSMRHRKYQG